MKVLKAKFKDEAGYYTMIWSYNPNMWEVKDILANEMIKSNSKLIELKETIKQDHEKLN
jgi:hypothetical protein